MISKAFCLLIQYDQTLLQGSAQLHILARINNKIAHRTALVTNRFTEMRLHLYVLFFH